MLFIVHYTKYRTYLWYTIHFIEHAIYSALYYILNIFMVHNTIHRTTILLCIRFTTLKKITSKINLSSS